MTTTFMFEDVERGTKEQKKMMKQLAKLADDGYYTLYEEYTARTLEGKIVDMCKGVASREPI